MKNTLSGKWIALALALVISASCSKSPAEEMADIGKTMPGVICDKMLECIKPMIERMPEQARGMMPPIFQSKDACVQEVSKEQKIREEKKDKITKEMVVLAKDCMTEFKKLECEQMQTGAMKAPESCQKLSQMTKSM